MGRGDTAAHDLLRTLTPLAETLKTRAIIAPIGREDLFNRCNGSNLAPIFAEQTVDMCANPHSALRTKGGSSIALGIAQLRAKSADAFITAGNTGALFAFAAAKSGLPPLPGVTRPALLAEIPTADRPMSVLDVGAQVHWSASNLLQYAAIGKAYHKTLGNNHPTIGLLNIGSERDKGPQELQKAFNLLQNEPHFLGNIEGKDAFSGNIDILITDGFTGNIFLKTSEGIAAHLLKLLGKNSSDAMGAELSTLSSKINPDSYPGAILAGLNGIVIKCHGDSSPESIISSIHRAITLHEQHFITNLKSELDKITE